MANNNNRQLVKVALHGVYLSAEALRHIYMWWKGEISGRRAAKSIVDSSVTVGAGLSGGAGGAIVGAVVAGPLGGLVGGALGGILGAAAANILIDKLTRNIFDLPKTVAEENAYEYLGVSSSASNSDVNAAFWELCRKHHPDKGGDEEEFKILQAHMAIIRLARGDL